MGYVVHEVPTAEVNGYFPVWRAFLENSRIKNKGLILNEVK